MEETTTGRAGLSAGPRHGAVGLVLIGLRAGLAAHLRWSIDDRDSMADAIAVATDLVRTLEVDDPAESPPSAPGSIREPGTGWDSLTEMERLVARLIADGYTNEQAARKLGRSKHTIGTHLRSVFVKMQVQSRVQLANAVAGRDDRRPGRRLAG